MPSDRSLCIAIELIKKKSSIYWHDLWFDFFVQSKHWNRRISLFCSRNLISGLFKFFNFPIKFITRAVKEQDRSRPILLHGSLCSFSRSVLSFSSLVRCSCSMLLHRALRSRSGRTGSPCSHFQSQCVLMKISLHRHEWQSVCIELIRRHLSRSLDTHEKRITWSD